MRKAIQVIFGTYVASQSVLFEKSSLLPNIEALYINSPVATSCDCRRKCTATTSLLVYVSFYKSIATQEETLCDCRRKCTKPHPFLRMFLFTKIYSRRGVFNAYLQILLLDFSP